MVQGTAKLVIDLGNSETRVKTYFGKNMKGNARSRLTVMSNRYAEVPQNLLEGYLNDGVYTDEESRIFNCNGNIWCAGRLCEEELAHASSRPTAMEKKYNSLISKLSILSAFSQGFLDVAEFANCSVDSLDVDWEVIVLLPPEDLQVGGRQMGDMVRSIEKIDFLMPELHKDIRIKEGGVKVLPEGFCAFLAVVMQSKTSLRPGYANIVNNGELTLVSDIGAGTTDFMLVRGAQIVSSSLFTREIGGNNVHRLVQRALRNKGISLPDSEVRKGCEVGYVMSGPRKIPIASELADAKKVVSRQLVDAVQEFFESSMIPIRTISNILVCGGGAEAPEDIEGIEPIANYITEYIRVLAPDIQQIELPVEGKDENRRRLSPRLLNIIGAGYMAE